LSTKIEDNHPPKQKFNQNQYDVKIRCVKFSWFDLAKILKIGLPFEPVSATTPQPASQLKHGFHVFVHDDPELTSGAPDIRND